MEAKGVPVFYLPAVYYPITKDDRATGFLMPTYGTSTYRGYSLSNAFFWAIDRSRDLTLVDDWFSSRGNGMGAEYRYASAPGSSGFVKFYRLSEHASTIQNTDGSSSQIPGALSYRVQANAAQALAGHWSARASVDYFTSLTVQQAYNTNIYDASNSTRTYSGSLTGNLAGFTVNGQVRSDRVLLGRQRLDGHRRHAARHAHPQRAAPVRDAALLLDEQRVRHAHARDEVGRHDHQPRAEARRPDADHPVPLHEMVVPDRQLLGLVAGHLLDAQPVAGRQRGGRRRPARAIVFRRRVAHHGAGLHPGVEHARTAASRRSGSTRSSRT